MSTYIWLGIPAFILVVIALMYNGLITKKNQVSYAYSSLDAWLQKRYDLVPNLVETVKGYMTHERELFTRIAQIRTQGLTARAAPAQLALSDKMTEALGHVFAISENYPALQASDNFLKLQAALNEMEEQIAAARRAFNASVTDYNNAVEMFPTSLMAGMMGLTKQSWFEAAAAERQAVDISGRLG